MSAELEGADLDLAVVRAEGYRFNGYDIPYNGCDLKDEVVEDHRHFRPSTDWKHGGPIIERHIHWLRHDPQELSAVTVGNTTTYKYDMENAWEAGCYTADDPQGESHVRARGPTMLIAAMRCYVAKKLSSSAGDGSAGT